MKKILDKKVGTEQETVLLAKELYENYLAHDTNFTIFFEGGLGAGKTFMVRQIIRNLGVNDEVTSPTYIYVNEYTGDNQKKYAHFDLYRINDDHEFFAHGFDEIIEDTRISKLVEWPDKISREIQRAFSGVLYCVSISYGKDGITREIIISRQT